MGLVAFKIEGAFGSRAVVGKHDAVVFGLLGREKGRACLFGQVLGDKVAVLGDADRIAQGAGQSLVTGAYLVGGGEQVFVVFPPPDGPTKAVTSPCLAVKETSFNTVSPVL